MYDPIEHKKAVIDRCDKYNEIVELEDGFKYFWVKDRGALSAGDLRIIADELDDRNKDYQEQVDSYLNAIEKDD